MDKHTLAVIIVAGLSATVAQLAALRELLVLFYGIELFIGVVLACWLLWNGLGCSLASRYAPLIKAPRTALTTILSVTALILPATVLFIRTARSICPIEPGELPSMGSMLGICLVSTSLPSIVSGALFGLCWVFYAKPLKAAPHPLPLTVYVGEAVGAALGGTGFYIFLTVHSPLFTALWGVCLILLLVAGGILFFKASRPSLLRAGPIWLIIACLVGCGFMFRSKVELLSRRLQWGPHVIAVEDTPFQNLALVRTGGQYSVFSNGLWRYSVPDTLSEEYAVHPALLQHPDPQRVLLLGSSSTRLATQALKHNETLTVDVVESDPWVFEFDQAHIPSHHPTLPARIRLHYQDAARFVVEVHQPYQAILMNLGDPINAQMNRFYTISFFRNIKQALAPGGIFSLSVSGGEDMLGEDQILFLKGLKQTLQQVFPQIFVLPGERLQFFATDATGDFVKDPRKIAERIRRRGLLPAYVRPDTLPYLLSPRRLQYFQSVLADPGTAQVNTDFSPLCYQRALGLLTAQWHPRMQRLLAALSDLPLSALWGFIFLTGSIAIIIFFPKKKPIAPPVFMSVGVTGAFTLSLQMVLLLVFQIFMGMLYLQMVLIVTAFMLGLAAGAGWVSRQYDLEKTPFRIKKQFILVQVLLFLYPLCLMALFSGIHLFTQTHLLPPEAGMLFTLLSLLAGILGGLHFSLAAQVVHTFDTSALTMGGHLYAADLVGAAAGVLLTSFCLIPLLGPLQTLLVWSFAAGACLLILIRRL